MASKSWVKMFTTTSNTYLHQLKIEIVYKNKDFNT